jgi:hypothetical protein
MKETPLVKMAARQALAAGMTPQQGGRELQKEMIVESLKENHGNACRTARALHMHRNTLSRKITELRIEDLVEDFRAELRNQLRNQKPLRFGGRLPARRMTNQSDVDIQDDRSRVA